MLAGIVSSEGDCVTDAASDAVWPLRVVTVPEECRGSARSSPDPDAGSDGLGPLPRLVDLVVGSHDAPRFIAAAAEALGEPLGVVAVTGQALGYAPDAQGRRALAVAAAAALTPLIAPPG